MDPQILHGLQFPELSGHGLSRKSFAHLLGLGASLAVVDPTSGVITALPADGHGGVVAEWKDTYKTKVSIQAA